MRSEIVPRWVVSIGLLAGVYAAVMVAAALWMPHEWDWQVLRWLGSRLTPEFSPEVSIVDIPWNASDFAGNRRRIARFLDGLVKSNQRPNAVILDVEFDPCQSNPCGAPMTSADNALARSIRAATRRFPVYATEEPRLGNDDVIVGPLDPQDPQIYAVITGAAQTHFTSVPNAQGLFYRICYGGVPIDNASGQIVATQNVWAMVARVLMTPRIFAGSPACDPSHIPVRLGTADALAPATYRFTDAKSFAAYSQFDDKMYVIVGTIEEDRPPFTGRSGPELLGWALSNALDQGSLVGRSPYYDVQPQNAMLLLLVPAFSAFVVLAYSAAFFEMKRFRLRGWRHRLSWMSSAVAALAGIAIVALFELWLLLSHHIQPQVSLIVLGIVTAAGLCGVRGSQLMFEESNAIEAEAAAETYDYDVFVSYAHEDQAWVFEHVVGPLREAELLDGRRLSVFFDVSSIRAGTAWQTKLSLAIDQSRFIVPVYSEAYFKQPYCRFEIMRAHRKWVRAGEQSRCVLPIVLGHPAIPPAVDDIQALSIDDHPDLVAQHISEIVARLSGSSRQEASIS